LKTKILIIAIIILTVFSCTKVPNNGIPTYIKLTNPTIETTSETQGSKIHGFSDIWISEGAKDLGAYEYPKTFAVLLSGEKELTLNPGIKFNADESDRRVYPIFEPLKVTYNFIQKDTIEVLPVFKYREGVDFVYIEEFESSNNFDDMYRTDSGNTNNIDGKAGVLTLASSEKDKYAITISPIEITQGKRIYLEFSIKTESYVGVGFKSTKTSEYTSLAIFSPNAEWENYYFEVTQFINATKEGEYNFYLNAQKVNEGEEEQTYFDNFKIIAF